MMQPGQSIVGLTAIPRGAEDIDNGSLAGVRVDEGLASYSISEMGEIEAPQLGTGRIQAKGESLINIVSDSRINRDGLTGLLNTFSDIRVVTSYDAQACFE